jgi:hypothetical protein
LLHRTRPPSFPLCRRRRLPLCVVSIEFSYEARHRHEAPRSQAWPTATRLSHRLQLFRRQCIGKFGDFDFLNGYFGPQRLECSSVKMTDHHFIMPGSLLPQLGIWCAFVLLTSGCIPHHFVVQWPTLDDSVSRSSSRLGRHRLVTSGRG